MIYGTKNTETGELEHIFESTHSTHGQFDLDTGELGSKTKKIKFSIPRELIDPVEPKKKCCVDPYDNFTLTRKEQVIHLQEEIIQGYNKTSYRLFLIPSLLLFSHYAAFIITILEVCVHIWAHKKNSQNKNPCIYYRSPLHIISSQFCAICRNQKEMELVKKMQDRRQKCWKMNLKEMARTII